MRIPLDTIPQRDRQTDRQTGRQTGENPILHRAHTRWVCWRTKNNHGYL